MNTMKRKKLLTITGVCALIAAAITASVLSSGQEIVEVQISEVKRRKLLESKVTANGEVRPVKFYNLTAEVSGRVTNIYVREGDEVKADQELLRVDPTQQANNAASQEAILRAEETDARNSEIQLQAAINNVNSTKNLILAAQAELRRAEADLQLARADFQHAAEMVEAGIFSRSQYDTAKMRFEAAEASVAAQQARIEQLQYQLRDAQAAVIRAENSNKAIQERLKATRAQLANARDLLFKTVKKSPINGIVSSLPVKEGEFVVANLSSSPLMMIADMSDVNVEVKVDETDIASIKIGQPAKVKVDALGETEINGKVIEIGHSAVTRSGQTIAQTNTSSQEAKDFKVVVKLEADQATLGKLRPGMSATATITTDTRNDVLTVPIQALVIKDLGNEAGEKRETQGVFLVKDGKAEFVEIKTGITGDTEIEILSGLNENDKIVIGPFRQLRNLKSGTAVTQEKKTDKEDKSGDK